MTTPVLAVEKLYGDVQDYFASKAGKRSLLETASFTGTAAPAFGVPGPTDNAEAKLLFTVGGVVGVPGIMYQASTDDGATFGPVTALGLATMIVLLGTTIDLTPAGTVNANDVLRWTQTTPTIPVQPFGTRRPAERGETLRLVWVPGDDADAGEWMSARNPGRNPRPLITLKDLVTVYVEAFDETQTESDELAQWKATRLLEDAFLAAVQTIAHGTFEVVSRTYVNDKSTRRHGFAIRVVLAVQSMVPDVPSYTVPAQASVTTSLGSQNDGPDIVTA